MTETMEDYETETFGGANKASVSRNMSFFDYITTTSSNEKAQLLNLMQYGGLVIIPLILVLKLMKMYVPVEDSYKSTLEITIEVLVELAVIIVLFFIIHKLVVYVPTYSKVEYDNISLLSTILPLFFIIFSLDTKLSEKLNILLDRFLMAVGLKKESFSEYPPPESTSQIVAQNGACTPPMPQLPNVVNMMPSNNEQMPPPQMTHQIQQQMPQQQQQHEQMFDEGPMAANSVIGGSLF